VGKLQALVKRVGSSGLVMVGRASSGHWIPMDTAEEVGGTDGGSRPLELILIALGGCTAMDVLSILAKKRIKLDDCEVHLEADRAEEHPKVLTRITLVYHFYGDGLRSEDLQQAVQLSEEKYCSVSAMLRQAAPVETRIEIHPPRPAK
jgi:putative redox protein